VLNSPSKIPLPLEGYTIITPPNHDDKKNEAAYGKLCDLSDKLSVPGIVPVPSEAWHMTLADLISEGNYAELLAKENEKNLIDYIQALFNQIKKMGVLSECKMKIKGIGLFPHCIVAIVAPNNKQSYDVLIMLRDILYESQNLQNLGIKRPEPYGFHITLAYVEAYLTEKNRIMLTDEISKINDKWPCNDIEFIVDQANLSKFENMSNFMVDIGTQTANKRIELTW